jgi:hypothetical protein
VSISPPVSDESDLEPLDLQNPREHLAHGGLVVDDQDAHRRASSPTNLKVR